MTSKPETGAVSPRATSDRRVLWTVLGLTTLGALVRFSTLGVQSFWFEEVVTISVVRRGLDDLIAAVAGDESTPPLYYALLWFWSRLWGTSEVALRSLSAVFGTLTIPVAYGIGTVFVSRRVGLVLAGLVTVAPLLVFYSQESRSYALLVLLCGLSTLAFGRALERPNRRSLGAWALSSALALATHYFAVFVVATEALWLLIGTRRRRAAAVATTAVVLTGIGLLPLALHQESADRAAWIDNTPLLIRMKVTAKSFVAGLDNIGDQFWLAVAATVLVVTAVLLLLIRADRSERNGAMLVGAIGAAAAAGPVAVALAGIDFVYYRNLLPAWLPLTLVAAAGFGARQAGRLGIAGAVALWGIWCAVTLLDTFTPRHQRDGWRSVAAALRPEPNGRAVVITPGGSAATLRHYKPWLCRLPRVGASVTEIALVGAAKAAQIGLGPPPDLSEPPPLRAFARIEARSIPGNLRLVRFRSSRPVFVRPRTLVPRYAIGLVNDYGRGPDRRGVDIMLDPTEPRAQCARVLP
jgi:mannosyltransferase